MKCFPFCGIRKWKECYEKAEMEEVQILLQHKQVRRSNGIASNSYLYLDSCTYFMLHTVQHLLRYD